MKRQLTNGTWVSFGFGGAKSFEKNVFNVPDDAKASPEIEGRYFFSIQRFSPYVFAGLNMVSGSVTSKETGTLNHTGFSFCGGTGVSLKLGESFALSRETIAFLGSASWKQKPFLNSNGREFNPSLLSLTLNLSYLLGNPEESQF
jgi:hypothetical protein